MKTILTAVALSTIALTGAEAGGMNTLKANSDAQHKRIEFGRTTGDLTRREYRELKAEQDNIDRQLAAASADGRLSRKEYNEIHRRQIVAYRGIESETSDRQRNWLRRWLFVTRN